MADHTEITQVKKESKEGKGRTIQKYPAFLRYILQKAHQNNQPDLQMAYRLIHLQRQAKLYQYLFACISTLGGANHLCNRPQEALVLAERQCLVARMLGSKKLYIKSRVFIAVNYALLKKRKKSEKIFQECIFLSSQIQCNDTLHFIKAIKLWLLRELAIEDMNYCKGKKGYSDMGRGKLFIYSILTFFSFLSFFLGLFASDCTNVASPFTALVTTISQ